MDGSAVDGAPFVRILGPVGLSSGGSSISLGGPLPRAFLAAVALRSPQPVSIDRLTALLWGDDPPAGVKVAIQQLATRVRRALAIAGAGHALRAVPPGYALELDASAVDVRMFRASVRAGGEAQRAGDHSRAADALSEGLALWTGAAMADLIDLPIAEMVCHAVDEERWRAEEQRAESLLASGRPGDAAIALAAATAEAPLRERLWVLQATALAAEGRIDDAVRCTRTAAAVITAELGVPPGPELAALEQELRTALIAGAPRPVVPPISQVARHGLLDGALRRALLNAEQAARTATERLAHGEAVAQWQRALELLDTVDPDDDSTRLRLLLGLGNAHNVASLDAQARTSFTEAAAIARRHDDACGLAAAALGYCADRIGFAPPVEQTEILEEALAALPRSERLLRGRLLARLATEQYWTGTIDRTLELAEEAAREASAADDDEGRLLAQYAMAFGCWTPDRTPELVKVCEAYLDDARALGDRRHELLAHRWLVPAVTELGDVARGGREAVAAIEMADELQLSVQQWISRVIAASHQIVVGDLARAEALGTEALAIGSVSEPEVALDYVSLLIWTLRWLQGRLVEIVGLVEQAAATPGVDTARRLGLALTHAELGRLDEARAVLDQVSAAEMDALQQDASWYIAMAAMAEAAAACGHVGAASIAYERLLPYRDRISVTSVTATGPVAHHVGIAAWTLGDHAAGERALLDAIDVADEAGAPVFGARSRVALAERLCESRDHARGAPRAGGTARGGGARARGRAHGSRRRPGTLCRRHRASPCRRPLRQRRRRSRTVGRDDRHDDRERSSTTIEHGPADGRSVAEMRIIISGSSGLIGTSLVARLRGDGHDVVRLVRRPAAGSGESTWDPAAGTLDATVVDGADAVINLAGAGIGDKRWTDEYKETLRASRLSSTGLLADAIAAASNKPSVFVSGSAIGWYGDRRRSGARRDVDRRERLPGRPRGRLGGSGAAGRGRRRADRARCGRGSCCPEREAH